MHVNHSEIAAVSRIETASATCLVLRTLSAIVFLSAVALVACWSEKPQQTPSITFTKIPPAAQGGRERVDTISGRVSGARPGQRIVVYAKSGPWWVQPWPEQPFIALQSDSTWSTQTHLGYEYAALLVDPHYHPAPTMDVAPTEGGSVVAMKIVKGVGSLPDSPTVPLHFSGYDWKVRTISSARGGVNNLFDGGNAWTDKSGDLHLRITKKSGNWYCAEVDLTRSLGYGTYSIVVRDTSHLEPAVILSMNTFDVWAGEEHFRELDMEIGRWGRANNEDNAQYGIQPFYVPGNVASLKEPPGTITHTLRWEPGRASFEAVRGSSLNGEGPVVFHHAFTSGVPSAGSEVFQLILYVVPSDESPLQREAEVVVEKFEYLP